MSSTLKITQAMKMVASAKLRKAQKMVGGLDAYKTALYAILGSLKAYLALSPLAKPSSGSKVAVVVFSSHTALCGSYNANIFKALEKEIGRLTSEGKTVVVYPVGEKVAKMSRKAGYDLCNDFVGCADKLSYDDMATLAQYMIDRFTAGEFGAVELLYMHYHSAARQSVEVQTWLPVSGDIPGSDARQVDPDLIVEPSAEEVASGLLPLAMRTDMYATLLYDCDADCFRQCPGTAAAADADLQQAAPAGHYGRAYGHFQRQAGRLVLGCKDYTCGNNCEGDNKFHSCIILFSDTKFSS